MPSVAPAELERRPVARAVRAAGEVALMLLAFGTVWPFGSVEEFWESAATAGTALLTVLWAIHTILTRSLRLRFDAPAFILCGLILLSGAQLIPLPRGIVRLVSPSTVMWREAMLPETGELLPGETASAARSTAYPISLDPPSTRLFAARMFTLLAVYLAARNWLADRESFRRLAWAALLTGVSLAALALGQFFSSPPSVIYWSVLTTGTVFGPFVCRNHYPDFIALCAGLAIGLMVTKRPPPAYGAERETGPGSFWDEFTAMISAPLQLLQQPAVLAAAAGVGLMLVSIPFSLSRGGVLAFLVATLGVFVLARWRRKNAVPSGNRTAVTAATSVALCVVAWFGWAPIEKRFGEIGSGPTVDDRTVLWNASFRQLPGFWFAGAGNGSHLRIEPLGREDADRAANSAVEHAHNEYVEAAIEGGLVRLGLTLALPVMVLVSLARGFRKLQSRTAGPLILGALFGLAVVAAHAATDFALHIPAVPLLAIIVAAYAMAAAHDSEFLLVKQKRRGSPARTEVGIAPITSRATFLGFPAIVLACTLGSLMILLAWQSNRRAVAEKYLIAGMAQGRSLNPDRCRTRIEYLEASTAANPINPEAFFELAQAHLDAATDLGPTPAEAVAGPVLPRRARSERYSPEMLERHILPALRALRTARDLCPLLPEVHARLGLLAEYWSRSEPALVHLDRAKLLLKSDPEIRFACGVEAAKAGDRARAITEWKKSLELSPKQLRPILRAAGKSLSPEEMLRSLLPDDPVVLMGAADELYPNRRTQRSERRPFVERAAAGHRPDATVVHWVASATANEELNRGADARRAWERALELDSDRGPTRDGLARFLEADEQYADALPHLEWLLAKNPNDPGYRLRHKAAVHGAKLRREIGE